MLKAFSVVIAGEFLSVGNEFVSIDGLSIPIDAVISLSIEPLEEA